MLKYDYKEIPARLMEQREKNKDGKLVNLICKIPAWVFSTIVFAGLASAIILSPGCDSSSKDNYAPGKSGCFISTLRRDYSQGAQGYAKRGNKEKVDNDVCFIDTLTRNY